MNLFDIWRRWTAPTTTGELAQRREAVLLQALAAMLPLSLATQVLQLVGLAEGEPISNLIWWAINAAVGLGCYWLLRTARTGHLRRSSIVLVGALSTVAVALIVTGGSDHAIFAALLALIVVLAAVLLGGQAGVVVAALLGSSYIVIDRLEGAGVFTPPSDGQTGALSAIAVALILGVCAVICRSYTRDVLISVDEALSHAAPSSPLRQLRTKHLSLREIEVVQLVAAGLSNDAIAAKLFVSPRTVQSHVANAMKKTDSDNRTQLGVLAVREGLVPLEEHVDVDGRSALEPDRA